MTYNLTESETALLAKLQERNPYVNAVLQQLERILTSETFKKSQEKTKGFLAFIVAKELIGHGEEIKEMTVAMSVYGSDPGCDQDESNKVRVAAGSLRSKLEDYFKGEGKDDPIRILIPLGTYVPQITESWPRITVDLFQDWSPAVDQSYLCRAVRDEIAHLLRQANGVTVETDPSEVSCRYNLRGYIQSWQDMLRLNFSLIDSRLGSVVDHGELEGQRDDILKLSRQVAEAALFVLKPIRKPIVGEKRDVSKPNGRRVGLRP